jgi:hypothetical protein
VRWKKGGVAKYQWKKKLKEVQELSCSLVTTSSVGVDSLESCLVGKVSLSK